MKEEEEEEEERRSGNGDGNGDGNGNGSGGGGGSVARSPACKNNQKLKKCLLNQPGQDPSESKP